MRAPDFAPLAAWIMWEMLFDEPKPADTQPKAPTVPTPSAVKKGPGSK